MNRKIALMLIVLFSLTSCSKNDASKQNLNEHLYKTMLENGLNKARNGDYDSALAHLKKAISVNPEALDAYLILGDVLTRKGSLNDAKALYLRTLQIFPGNRKALLELGNCLFNQGEFKDAKKCYVNILKKNPKDVDAMMGAGNCCFVLEEYDISKMMFSRALKVKPDPVLTMNLGSTLFKLNEIETAERLLKDALKALPNSALANLNYSILKLLKGELQEAYPIYNEWRWKGYAKTKPNFNKPELAKGSELSGKTVLIYSEQGMGDVFQFIRYASVLKKKGAKVLLSLHIKHLKKIMSMLPYIDEVYLREEPLPDFDLCVSSMNLTEVLGATVDNIPSEVSHPYLSVGDDLVSFWKKQLSKDKNFKIGICLHGQEKTEFQKGNDGAQFTGCKRSVPENMIPQFNGIDGVTLYSLEPFFDYGKSLKIHQFDKTFDRKNGSFMDTAAVMKNMDLVITVDTSIAHLAGGLGVPVWVLLPFHPDWRWFLNRDDSPWYPTARLFRQPKNGDWEPVIKKVKEELKKLVNRKK